MIPPALLFLLRLALAIRGLLCFRMNFKGRFFNLYDVIGILLDIALNM
jgi:hypothetical protein